MKVKKVFLILAFLGALLIDFGIAQMIFRQDDGIVSELKIMKMTSRDQTISRLSSFRSGPAPAHFKRFPELLPKDAWDHTMTYDEAADGKSYRIISAGDDGVFGTEDDIAYSSITNKVEYKLPPKNYLAEDILPCAAFFLVLNYLVHLIFVIPYALIRRKTSKGHIALLAACIFTWLSVLPAYLEYKSDRKRRGFYGSLYFLSYVLAVLIFYLTLIRK